MTSKIPNSFSQPLVNAPFYPISPWFQSMGKEFVFSQHPRLASIITPFIFISRAAYCN